MKVYRLDPYGIQIIFKKNVKFQRYKLQKFKDYFDQTICLPSGYNLKNSEMNKIIKILVRIQSEL